MRRIQPYNNTTAETSNPLCERIISHSIRIMLLTQWNGKFAHHFYTRLAVEIEHETIRLKYMYLAMCSYWQS